MSNRPWKILEETRIDIPVDSRSVVVPEYLPQPTGSFVGSPSYAAWRGAVRRIDSCADRTARRIYIPRESCEMWRGPVRRIDSRADRTA
eukprot:9491128-Pyramimonas_sp.AAC.1